MQKRLILLLALVFAGIPAFAQYTYLVNKCPVINSEKCKIYKYNGSSSRKLEMAGGEYGYGGFNFYDVGAFVTFNLGGQYETLTFTMGHYERCTEDVGVVTVTADGKKILDEKIRGYEIPRKYSLNVAGVKELTFRIVMEDLDMIVADAVLWKKGQTVTEVRKSKSETPKVRELVKDIKPYYVSNFTTIVTPEEGSKIRLNRRVYDYGIRGNMTMALIGAYNGFAYFNVKRQYTKLSFVAGCHDDVTGGAGSGWITVKADGKIVDEIEIKEGDIARQIVMDIPECDVLSFHTMQDNGESYAEIADIKVYPKGQDADIAETEDGLIPPDPRLKTLPDACKLISSIPPYTVVGKVKKQIYDGASDYLTFSMGGTKFNEGIILYQTASFWDDNLSACAIFDVGNEFDYISFTAGYVGKSWNMNEDYLMVYADDVLVFSTPLVPTYPNQKFIVPINKCRTLRFANAGSGTLDVAAYGVADIVIYRGDPVENDLFVHPEPECPYEINLLELGLPYIHYVSTMSDHRDEIVKDGSTKKNYFELGGERINNGFILQTSTHFSLDFGVLGSGNNSAAASIVGGAAVGASFVAGATAVGGATVGATVAPLGAFLLLAAGGEAVENSCAAFNTYGEYNSVTFKVGCLSTAERKSKDHELLMIGADHQVVANLGVYESMEPQEITVPINGCEQLMFWLANTNGTSAKYLIYDIVVSKEAKPAFTPVPARMSLPVIEEIKGNEYELYGDYQGAPNSYKSDAVDSYLASARSYYGRVCDYIKDYRSDYVIYTYYLESENGMIFKAVQLKTSEDSRSGWDIYDYYDKLVNRQLKNLYELKMQKAQLLLDNVSANAGLLELGFAAIEYRRHIKDCAALVKACFPIVDQMYEEKLQEAAMIEAIIRGACTVDGVSSQDDFVICPVGPGDEIPDYPLQHVIYFDKIED